MLLKTYRVATAKLSREKAGKELGVDGITLWRWENGRSIPEADNLRKIMEWSNGQVTPNDFIKAKKGPSGEVAA